MNVTRQTSHSETVWESTTRPSISTCCSEHPLSHLSACSAHCQAAWTAAGQAAVSCTIGKRQCLQHMMLEVSLTLSTMQRDASSKLLTSTFSVSRKFSQKFHDFFETVILKGKALGDVTHHFYKKEYQARGAPHYHILLWIDGAPVAGT